MKQLTMIICALYCLALPVAQATQAPATTETTEVVIPSEAELAQLLAPIALYPDSLLTHILIASTYPLEVIEAERWLKDNKDLTHAQIVDLTINKDWDPSVLALLSFPNVLSKMSSELNWTRSLGDAFLAAEKQVLASIQTLRDQADAAGNLDKMDNVIVTREDDNIIIQPVQKEVVYVPYYDTRVVYGPWHWGYYPPVYWSYWGPHHSPYYASAHYTSHAPFYWHPAVHISVGWWFSNFHWSNHHVAVSHHNHSYYHRHSHGYKRHSSYGKSYNSHNSKHKVAKSTGGKRWQHNPAHRKGVAYKSDKMTKRYSTAQYKSQRPSMQQSKHVRKHERNAIANQSFNKSKNKSNKYTTNRGHKTGQVNKHSKVSRHHDLKKKMNSQHQIKQAKRDGQKQNYKSYTSNKTRATKIKQQRKAATAKKYYTTSAKAKTKTYNTAAKPAKRGSVNTTKSYDNKSYVPKRSTQIKTYNKAVKTSKHTSRSSSKSYATKSYSNKNNSKSYKSSTPKSYKSRSSYSRSSKRSSSHKKR
ncbi:DUF3300 domain-containing protein [Thalassotalea sp. ND16A]|uniref:DUF3300 domain-containing protein n=1 Tax=Thalassotalea sp. ND16A TaxID=1535422 RepID=UPI00051D78ED|nr:DUF3300 domain-containing protein [Thalassotalea sp. ND16A]KGJ96825.1 hypothetical protein ND16A_1018 [Thalassotalea sp. ND16A]